MIISKLIKSPFSDLSSLFLLTPGMNGVPNSFGRIQLIWKYGGETETSTSDVQTKVGIGTPLSMGGAVGNCIGTSGPGSTSSWRPADESLQMMRHSRPGADHVCSKIVASRRHAVVTEESVLW